MRADHMNTTNDSRRRELAKIHIARKDLCLDDEAYQQVIRNIGGSGSGSSADLSPLGRARVLQHFLDKGWKSKRRPAQKRITTSGDTLASISQVALIRVLWVKMAEAGIIQNRTEQGLRAWVKASSRRYHPGKAGYSATEFLPEWVAQRLIEHLKQWAARCGTNLDE
jgi:phage gp16-like protein